MLVNHPKAKAWGLCEAYTEGSLHKLKGFLQEPCECHTRICYIAVSWRGSQSYVSDAPQV